MTDAAPRKKNILRVLIPVLVLGAIGVYGTYWYKTGRFIQSTDNAYVKADISVLTPRVGGEITAVHVKDNQAIEFNELLIEIDPSDYAAKVENARAAVAQAEAALANNGQQRELQHSLIAEAQANWNAAKASEQQMRREWERADALVKDGVATHQRLDNAEGAYKNAVANVEHAAAAMQASRQQLGALSQSDRARLDAVLIAAKAQLHLAEIDLAATQIRAPIAGTVGDLAARLGERTAVGQRLLSLVPLDKVYVEANFKETQLTRMSVGQRAEVSIDAFPGRPLAGHIESVSPASGAEFALLPAQNATGNFTKIVQRVPVKIVLDDGAGLHGLLRPGMSVEAKIFTRATAATPVQAEAPVPDAKS
ncbi:MAG: HlyD family secretion protein [Nevskia sp.]|jgi:membrane fusion protein (multidrug efflux system)|nr:HlyD family secretion protein [Nevskia sp.]MCK9384859.1 HlyD family secretion protein [Nevskia sp.]